MNIPRCPKCKNVNVSRNISNNELMCNRCGYNGSETITNTIEELYDEVQKNNEKKHKGEM